MLAAPTDDVGIGGVTIRNGSTILGGGIFWQSSRGLVLDSAVSSNTARAGGGLFNAGSLTVSGSVIDENRQLDVGVGGGVWNEGELQLTSSVVTNNQAENMGAGVGNGPGVLVIVESTVSGNTNVGGASGAGVLHSGDGGGLWNDGRALLTDTIVQGNSAVSEGGGILNEVNGTLEITGGAIDSNSAVVGPGGILNEGSLSITGATISNNSASIAGGILNAFGVAFIYDSTLSGNAASQVCGGLCAAGGSTNVFTSLITGNSAPEGGGVWGFEAEITLTNTTISSNSATGGGGGIAYCYCHLRNVTVTGNTADADGDGIGDGGGILLGSQSALNSGIAEMRNSLVAGNVDVGGEMPNVGCSAGGVVVSQGYNLLQDVYVPAPGTAGCSITDYATGNIYGHGAVLGPLADNGGPTETHALLLGSPAIDAGNPAPGSGGDTCENADQRGVARPQGGRCDIGAFEFASDTDADGCLDNIDVPDIDQNGQVAFRDLILLAGTYLATPSDARWDPRADFDMNNIVDFADLLVLAAVYNRRCP